LEQKLSQISTKQERVWEEQKQITQEVWTKTIDESGVEKIFETMTVNGELAAVLYSQESIEEVYAQYE
jgi:hypothetical protein